MSAADWGIPTPSQGMPITPFKTPFELQGDAIADALDLLRTFAFPRYEKKADLPTTNVLSRQHATVYGDTTAGNNGDYYWNGTSWVLIGVFAQASGVFTYSGTIPNGQFGSTTKITFPSGRFTLPPVVSVTPGNSRVNGAYSARTKDSFNIDLGNWSTNPAGNFEVSWTATQATATSATG